MNKLVSLVLVFVTGCSFVFTSGPPEQPRSYPDCTSSMTWPVVDGVFSAIFLLAMVSAIAGDETTMTGNEDDNATRGEKIGTSAVLAVATGAGAFVGYRRVARCRAARSSFYQNGSYPYGAPYGYPQPYPATQPPPYPGTQPAPQPQPYYPPQPQPQPQPPPPSSGLGTEGDVCAASAECATGLTCQGNVCIRPPPAK